MEEYQIIISVPGTLYLTRTGTEEIFTFQREKVANNLLTILTLQNIVTHWGISLINLILIFKF